MKETYKGGEMEKEANSLMTVEHGTHQMELHRRPTTCPMELDSILKYSTETKNTALLKW